MMPKYIGLLCLFVMVGCKAEHSELRLPAIISNHLVLQQSKEVALWGTARPGSKVNIATSWGCNEAVSVSSNSSWIAKIKTPKAGGAQQITIVNDDSTLVLSDVLLGEVWLCSGQSNMEMPLAGWPPSDTINNSAKEIASATFPDIRLFTVARNFSVNKLNDVSGSWATCTPQSAATFSATAYFFGKKLHQELGVPIGLINSSWGGTPAESWISGNELSKDVDFGNQIEKLNNSVPEEQAYRAWLEKHTQLNAKSIGATKDPIIGLTFFDGLCSTTSLEDSTWKPFTIPGNIESTSIGTFDGVVWLRKSIIVPATWTGDLQLNLGKIDDRDVTYFNGVQVGSHEEDGQWQMERHYVVPAALVQKGVNLIAIRLIDTQGGGGISGLPKDICITEKNGTSIPLAGTWKHRVVAEYRNSLFYLFNPLTDEFASRPKISIAQGANTASMLYNGMIAPLTNFAIKGAIWYQGESNVGRAAQYSRIFPLLINNWRKDFNNPDMPFYFTQIAPWDYSDVYAVSSAGLREAQRLTLTLNHTGMAVVLDVDNQKTIHPGNKKDVGERLARWALANDYGMKTVTSGPLYNSMSIDGSKIIISFTHVDGGLVLKPAATNGFEIAGSDHVFYSATVKIGAESVEVSSAKVKNPTTVRYAYHNGSTATLFNGEGLPASSFITSNEILE